MLSSPASFLVLMTHLLVLARAGGEDNTGGWFPPRDLSADIDAKAASFLSGRVDTLPPSALLVKCFKDHGLDPKIATPPDIVLSASIIIKGLPDADDHANKLKNAIEETCFAENLANYELNGDQGKDKVIVRLQIKESIEIGKKGVATSFCLDDAIRKFTGKPDLPDCTDFGL